MGRPVERAVNSPYSVTTLMLLARGNRLAGTVSQGVRTAAVHALDLPSHRDVQRLDAKIELLQRTIEERTAREHDLEAGA